MQKVNSKVGYWAVCLAEKKVKRMVVERAVRKVQRMADYLG